MIVALSDVKQMQTRHFDAGKTIGLVVGVVVLAGLAFIVALSTAFEGYTI